MRRVDVQNEVTQTPSVPDTISENKTRLIPLWNVVLLNDNDHTYEYVVEMLRKLFAYSLQKAFWMAVEVDTTGRVIVYTGPLEHCELRRNQIHSYGADHRIPHCAGSMSAVLESAE